MMISFYDDFINDINWVDRTCRQRVAGFPTRLQTVACKQIDGLEKLSRLSSGFFLLPIWLRDEFSVSRDICRELAASNVFGLRYFLLQDTIMDGSATDPILVPMSNLFHRHFIHIYNRLFSYDHIFWNYYQKYIDEWADSIIWEYSEHWGQKNNFEPDDLIILARKAAALKVPAAAVCFLAGRHDAVPVIEKMVDCWQGLFQLQDDCQDWLQDLKQGNYTLLLTKVADYNNVEDMERLTAAHVKKAVYIGGVEEDVLNMAIDLGQEALYCIDEFNLPYLKAYLDYQIKVLQKQCRSLEEQRNAILKGGLHVLKLLD